MLYIFPCYILDIRIKNIYIKNNNILTDKQIIEIANLKDYPNYYKTNTFKIKKETQTSLFFYGFVELLVIFNLFQLVNL